MHSLVWFVKTRSSVWMITKGLTKQRTDTSCSSKQHPLTVTETSENTVCLKTMNDYRVLYFKNWSQLRNKKRHLVQTITKSFLFCRMRFFSIAGTAEWWGLFETHGTVCGFDVKERDRLEELCLSRRIILKQILKK